jgi:D-arabinose 1-dehydrogenase-like Zn-dependent alcohol dehydrogenase
MRALYFDGTTLRCIDDHPAPAAGPDEALVGVRLARVCSTDLQISGNTGETVRVVLLAEPRSIVFNE